MSPPNPPTFTPQSLYAYTGQVVTYHDTTPYPPTFTPPPLHPPGCSDMLASRFDGRKSAIESVCSSPPAASAPGAAPPPAAPGAAPAPKTACHWCEKSSPSVDGVLRISFNSAMSSLSASNSGSNSSVSRSLGSEANERQPFEPFEPIDSVERLMKSRETEGAQIEATQTYRRLSSAFCPLSTRGSCR